MKFGMIGLGKMGYNLVQNAVDHDIEVVAFDQNEAIAREAEKYSEKITAAQSLENLLSKLPSPKIVWVMLPAGKRQIQQLHSFLSNSLLGTSLLMAEILTIKTT